MTPKRHKPARTQEHQEQQQGLGRKEIGMAGRVCLACRRDSWLTLETNPETIFTQRDDFERNEEESNKTRTRAHEDRAEWLLSRQKKTSPRVVLSENLKPKHNAQTHSGLRGSLNCIRA